MNLTFQVYVISSLFFQTSKSVALRKLNSIFMTLGPVGTNGLGAECHREAIGKKGSIETLALLTKQKIASNIHKMSVVVAF